MATIQKPALDLTAEALKFATETPAKTAPEAQEAIKPQKTGQGKGRPTKAAQQSKAQGSRVFFAPEGDRRLTINIREDLHKRLKIAAIEQDMTAGEIIEQLISQHI